MYVLPLIATETSSSTGRAGSSLRSARFEDIEGFLNGPCEVVRALTREGRQRIAIPSLECGEHPLIVVDDVAPVGMQPSGSGKNAAEPCFQHLMYFDERAVGGGFDCCSTDYPIELDGELLFVLSNVLHHPRILGTHHGDPRVVDVLADRRAGKSLKRA
jgi:hypothetical protein